MEKTVDVEHSLLFPPFRFDLVNERLWHGAQATDLRPKTFAVFKVHSPKSRPHIVSVLIPRLGKAL